MNFVAEIRDARSPLGRFFRDNLPNTPEVLKDVNRAVRESPQISVEPKHGMDGGAIGRAFGYGMAYHFGNPDVESLPAWLGASNIRSLEQRPLPVPWWLPDDFQTSERWLSLGEDLKAKILVLRDLYFTDTEAFRARFLGARPSIREEVLNDFFGSLEGFIGEVKPHRRTIPREDAETFARFCVVLSLLEQCYRQPPDRDSPLFSAGSVEGLMNIAFPDVVEDLCVIQEAAIRTLGSHGTKRTILGPVFKSSRYPADGDLILDDCLVDLKTTGKALPGWALYQILGYAWLDPTQEYGIDTIGIYVARRGLLFTWSVNDLARRLAGIQSLDEVRRRFASLALKPQTRRSRSRQKSEGSPVPRIR